MSSAARGQTKPKLTQTITKLGFTKLNTITETPSKQADLQNQKQSGREENPPDVGVLKRQWASKNKTAFSFGLKMDINLNLILCEIPGPGYQVLSTAQWVTLSPML